MTDEKLHVEPEYALPRRRRRNNHLTVGQHSILDEVARASLGLTSGQTDELLACGETTLSEDQVRSLARSVGRMIDRDKVAAAPLPVGWIEGIADLSHWQTEVDFVAMRNDGTLAVILKATQGTGFVDHTFVERVAAAKAAGLMVGAYHFADASEPIMQMHFFLSVAGSLPMLALDIEPNGVGDTVSVPKAAQMVSAIQSITKRLPLVYMGRYGPDGKGTGLPNSVLSRSPLWLPSYSKTPRPPPGWKQPMMWQYTDVPYDRNRWWGTEETLRAFWDGV